ncbi:hypothetical protein SLS58_007175 [Diplodia intermedia]|uniref:Uncharacterized protein n=1 Tax=Diplodia intermedia TaxID=856260 RepID=A0ABR3TLW6_9PEZI
MSNTNPKTRAAIKHYRTLLSPAQRMHFCLLPLPEQAAIALSASDSTPADPHTDAAIDPDYTPPPSDHSPSPSTSTTTPPPPTPTIPTPTLTCCTTPLATHRASLLATERALAAFSARLSSLLLGAGDALDAAAFQQHHLAALPAAAFAPARDGGAVRAWLEALMADLGVGGAWSCIW